MPIHGGIFREVFSEQQLEDLNNYLTATEKILRNQGLHPLPVQWALTSQVLIDESGLSTVPNRLPKAISPTGTKRVSKIVSAERGRNVTIICYINATGYYLPPFLVYARTRMLPELVERAPPGIVRHCSDNGLSTFPEKVISLWLDFQPTLPIVFSRSTFRFFGPLKTCYSQACDNFMVTQPGQAIADKKALSSYVDGFKECGTEPYDPLVINEYDFVATETTDHVLGTDNAESENATAQTAAPRGQHTGTPNESPDEHEAEQNEEPGPSGNVVSVKSKPCRSIFDSKPLPKERPCVKKRKSHSQCANVLTSTPMKEMVVQKEAQKVEQECLNQQRQEARAAKKKERKNRYQETEALF
ncbi:hypothetical protein PR048_017960, partial [Dryococelus australis]